MNPKRHIGEMLTARAEEILCSALAIEPDDERKAFLDEACQDDAELRALMDRLTGSYSAAEKFFAEGGVARLPMKALAQSLEEMPCPAGNLPAPVGKDEFVGRRVRQYLLREKIGEGGCGAVYRAEQEKPVRRQVAFKIIKPGMDSKSVIARFEAERQALALMEHPNIAKVLDAGATESRRPYFVMELVQGVKITEYSNQNELNTEQRLKLFIQICQAIQHAHQKGVIHRDIKPSNILVTTVDGKPVPKVIDFGIAKAVEGRLTDDTVFTSFEHFIGTPAYMSPEQALMSGVDVDTRSDIYSLGVLLYELLTGQTPFETKELLEKGIEGLRHTLLERDPRRPSVNLTAQSEAALSQLAHLRRTEPMKLISQLRGDLDWIVMRCLEKDRSRRYETANGLAMDIQRYLDNEPVLASPPGRVYRLQKLVRRNRVTFLAGTAVVLALVAGLSLATWFWYWEREARKRAVEAEQQKSRLLVESENREHITQAAFLISQDKIEEADELVTKVSAVKPSLETEAVLRKLGEWHALKGQWDQAAQRFNLLLEADQKDNSWSITDDLLLAGPILIERGDLAGYDAFRRAALARYTTPKDPGSDPVFAERTLKICLLIPADDQMMARLQPLYDYSANSMGTGGASDFWTAWRCISLALMAYRQNYTPTAIAWCEKSLVYQDRGLPRYAIARVIQAMSYYRLGETDTGRRALAQAHDMIVPRFANGMDKLDGDDGRWCDWLFAKILLDEAQAMFEQSSVPQK